MTRPLKDNIKQNVLHQVPRRPTAPPQLEQQAEQISSGVITALHTDRKNLMGGDLLRTFILITLAVVLLGLFMKKENITLLFLLHL